MSGSTLGAHADPDLAAARQAAERAATRALVELLRDLGLIFPTGVDPQQWAEGFAAQLAKIASPAAVDAAWSSLKRATRRPLEDGRGSGPAFLHPDQAISVPVVDDDEEADHG